ncbi:protein of unknown function (plasmid) [Cupriavidus taiwanensis]|uniref:Uncharacterized protein n=1 Tax=Cupriavidus taiwanensis TaxID=164546 RepID=A0A7Z7JIP2_9BURK|nr:hypothetical protein CBM2597_U50027 [Cupriavidus taiwanensis]SOZ97271.1 hypothetical protein CBM2598_U50027 [Cupriavidus taiwanensis]SPC26161.1 hypothetical protein CBM2594_U60027 [Cupriavidus taiwanensis]SPD37705.1 protein of unknown function [Cupriavidus taiwanensis]
MWLMIYLRPLGRLKLKARLLAAAVSYPAAPPVLKMGHTAVALASEARSNLQPPLLDLLK